ncbi:hypothetical protein AAHC03_022526 [Spirometra sp. Aus1]
MEMAGYAEISLEATSSRQSDAEQPRSSDAVVHACRSTHKLYTIEEVSEDEEEEEEEEEKGEDVEDTEDVDSREKPANDGLGDGYSEELRKAEAAQEENKCERKLAASEEQVKAGWGEEKKIQIKEETEESRHNLDEGEKKEEGAKEMTESRQDMILYNSKPFEVPQKNMKFKGMVTNLQRRHTEGEVESASADVAQQLTRAEKWAMRRHVGQWRNACASTESNGLLDQRRRRKSIRQRLRHIWSRFVCCGTPQVEENDLTF